MGTRADFYIREDSKLRWLGSVGWDGYDVEEMTEKDAEWGDRNASCWAIRQAQSPDEFLAAVDHYFGLRDDVTKPEQGWPWPWKDSCTTDRAYVFDGTSMKCYAWGREIVGEKAEGDHPAGGWPNMEDVQNVTIGTQRSGTILLQG
jgi:hypothetical protein